MATDYGMKISKAANDVKTATGTNLTFNSGYMVLKVHASGQITTTAATEYNIAHGLGYSPAFQAWGEKASGERVLLPDRNVNSSLVWGYAYATATYLKIYTTDISDVYYYIYVDKIFS